jgi:hypothetical protein
MGTLADAKTVYGGFTNQEEWVPVVYDFAVDGGEVEDNIVLTAGEDLVITDFYAEVITAVTSAGSLVADLGVGAGGTDIWSDKAVADLAIGTVHTFDTATKLKLASAGTVQLGVEAAAATAGKIRFWFKLKKFD